MVPGAEITYFRFERPERTDFWPERADFWPERADFRLSTSTSIIPVKESQRLVAPVLKVRHLHSCYPFLQISIIHFNKEHQLV